MESAESQYINHNSSSSSSSSGSSNTHHNFSLNIIDENSSIPSTSTKSSDMSSSSSPSPSFSSSSLSSPTVDLPPTSNTSTTSMDSTNEEELRSAAWTFCMKYHKCILFFFCFTVWLGERGVLLLLLGTVLIYLLDEYLYKEMTLKDWANHSVLALILVVAFVAILLICQFDDSPSSLFSYENIRMQEEFSIARLTKVIWIILLNDFIVRLTSLFLKAMIASIRTTTIAQLIQYCRWALTTMDSETAKPMGYFSLPSIARKKKQLFCWIELQSLLVRSIFSMFAWIMFYDSCCNHMIKYVVIACYLCIKTYYFIAYPVKFAYLTYNLFSPTKQYGEYVTEEMRNQHQTEECPICFDTPQPALLLRCGHMYCEQCINDWIDQHHSCPMCRQGIYTPNRAASKKSHWWSRFTPRERKPFMEVRTSLVPQHY